jgi:Asp-tRNA(Asn)/Glu-tRNA(Gln) amidotransferase A subunit family amidase
MRDLFFASATELIRLYRTRKVSPVEAMEAILAQVDRVNPQGNAIVTLARESARRAARAATRVL